MRSSIATVNCFSFFRHRSDTTQGRTEPAPPRAAGSGERGGEGREREGKGERRGGRGGGKESASAPKGEQARKRGQAPTAANEHKTSDTRPHDHANTRRRGRHGPPNPHDQQGPQGPTTPQSSRDKMYEEKKTPLQEYAQQQKRSTPS